MKDVRNNSVHNKVCVGAKLVAGKGGNAINEEGGSSFDVPIKDLREGTVHLETIAPIPVTTI